MTFIFIKERPPPPGLALHRRCCLHLESWSLESFHLYCCYSNRNLPLPHFLISIQCNLVGSQVAEEHRKCSLQIPSTSAIELVTEGKVLAQMVKKLPAMQETQVQSLGQVDPLEKGIANHSSALAWRIPWMEEPGGLQSMGSAKSQTQLSDSHTATKLPQVNSDTWCQQRKQHDSPPLFYLR